MLVRRISDCSTVSAIVCCSPQTKMYSLHISIVLIVLLHITDLEAAPRIEAEVRESFYKVLNSLPVDLILQDIKDKKTVQEIVDDVHKRFVRKSSLDELPKLAAAIKDFLGRVVPNNLLVEDLVSFVSRRDTEQQGMYNSLR